MFGLPSGLWMFVGGLCSTYSATLALTNLDVEVDNPVFVEECGLSRGHPLP